MSALATVAGNSFNSKFSTEKKNDFPIGCYVTINNADIGSLKSVHTLSEK